MRHQRDRNEIGELPQVKKFGWTQRGRPQIQEPRRSPLRPVDSGAKKNAERGEHNVRFEMGETPARMTRYSVIRNEFPSLLSSLLRFFAAPYPVGAQTFGCGVNSTSLPFSFFNSKSAKKCGDSRRMISHIAIATARISSSAWKLPRR
jgi:hypothetical protein